jgi:hypothetical protein
MRTLSAKQKEEVMKIRTTCVLVTVFALAGMASAQQVFVYPQKGQSQRQQDIDTAECTRWAKQQSGIDPNAPKQPDQVGTHARGAAGGAAKGAAVGAAVGAIGGDAGKGAAAGAVVGGVGGRRRSKQAKQAAEAETTNTYQRAFAACMDGRGYSVK